MDFFNAVGILLRRWPATLIGLILTFAAVFYVYDAVTPEYDASGQYYLVVPGESRVDVPVGAPITTAPALAENPFIQYGNLQIVSELVARRMNSPQVSDALKAEGADAEFLVDIVAGKSPTMLVKVTGSDEGAVLHAFDLVAKELNNELTQLQVDQGAPSNTLIKLDAIYEPTHTTLERASKIRAGVGVGILGLSVTVLGAFLLEGIFATRRSQPAPAPVDQGIHSLSPAASRVTSHPERTSLSSRFRARAGDRR